MGIFNFFKKENKSGDEPPEESSIKDQDEIDSHLNDMRAKNTRLRIKVDDTSYTYGGAAGEYPRFRGRGVI